MSGRFEAKIALVTGGGSGIGAATARRLADEGATVVITGRRLRNLEEVAALPTSGRMTPKQLDVTDAAAVRSVVAGIVEEFGRLDVVVNNAGIGPSGTIEQTTDADWHDMIATVLSGAFHTSKAALPHLKSTKGNIVNVSSVSGLGGDWGAASYNAAKGGLTNLTRALALDHAASGIRVNAVAPSLTRTDMTARVDADPVLFAGFMDRLPVGRAAEPAEVAAAIAFLASDDAAFVNGVILPVDGGLGASNGQPRLG
jgi:meso-butanediol dehydrogenase / (S,S)-butanediol dehydrogenase / diacetyl reductase